MIRYITTHEIIIARVNLITTRADCPSPRPNRLLLLVLNIYPIPLPQPGTCRWLPGRSSNMPSCSSRNNRWWWQWHSSSNKLLPIRSPTHITHTLELECCSAAQNLLSCFDKQLPLFYPFFFFLCFSIVSIVLGTIVFQSEIIQAKSVRPRLKAPNINSQAQSCHIATQQKFPVLH